MNKRDLLEKQIIDDANNGDTTVLAELLTLLTDKQVFNALSDANQELIKNETLYVLSENKINGIEINDEISQEDLFEYRITHRESLIDDIYRWIGECRRDCEKELMKDDVKYLETLSDEYIFSSVSTNEYICSDDENFNETCEELLELNNSLK